MPDSKGPRSTVLDPRDARREAIVCTDAAQLSAQQRACFQEISSRVERIAKEAYWPHERRQARRSLDVERRNRVLLIDGPRGSGKTTVLLSLLAQWLRPRQRGDRDADRVHVVPVEIVDLHPMPATANLVVALLGRMNALAVDYGIKESTSAPWVFQDRDGADEVDPAFRTRS